MEFNREPKGIGVETNRERINAIRDSINKKYLEATSGDYIDAGDLSEKEALTLKAEYEGRGLSASVVDDLNQEGRKSLLLFKPVDKDLITCQNRRVG